MALSRGLAPYDGELASSILLDDDDSASGAESSHDRQVAPPEDPLFLGLDPTPPYPSSAQTAPDSTQLGADTSALSGPGLLNPVVGGPVAGKGGQGCMASQRSLAPKREPTRTPSPDYQWNHPKKVPIADASSESVQYPPSSSSANAPNRLGVGGGASSEQPESNTPLFPMPFSPFLHTYWAGAFPEMQAYYSMFPGNQPVAQQVSTQGSNARSSSVVRGTVGGSSASAARGAGSAAADVTEEERDDTPYLPLSGVPDVSAGMPGSAMAQQGARGGNSFQWGAKGGGSAFSPADTRRAKPRSGGKGLMDAAGGFMSPTPVDVPASHGCGGCTAAGGGCASPSAGGCGGFGNGFAAPQVGNLPSSLGGLPRDAGGYVPGGYAMGKGDARRRGGGPGLDDPVATGAVSSSGAAGGKSRPQDIRGPPMGNPMIEQLRASRGVELSELAWNIGEIAQDQYGSRLIQQKLEVASEEEKQTAFVSVLQKMSQLTTDMFGNYVIQKFFEHGNPEQRRILSEQLIGQILRLSLQMYGCRVVQKALDSVPVEQQVLLVGELKGNVITCIEDQHGNHVIQKCIERLPTDKINFVVESFEGQACRMAKHCYGCRVLQRLIEYCASAQISSLLDEVLGQCGDLATDQYGNYVVQHVMEHSSRTRDRSSIMTMVQQNVLALSCHKYASNVVEKALTCGTLEERAGVIQAVVGEPGDPQSPLLTMMRDKFGNYIVQRVIHLAQNPQRQALFVKLQEQMPALKKSNTYGKHIITAYERARGPR